MKVAISSDNQEIFCDGTLCWFVQREQVRGEGTIYYGREHSAAARTVPWEVRQMVNKILNINSERKSSAISAMKRAYNALVEYSSKQEEKTG